MRPSWCSKCEEWKDEYSSGYIDNAEAWRVGNRPFVCRDCRAKAREVRELIGNLKQRRYTTEVNAKAKGYTPCSATLRQLLLTFTTHCQICDKECGTSIHLDHDHETGAFRGWLCSNCNWGIAHFCDQPRLLRRAALYLRRCGYKD